MFLQHRFARSLAPLGMTVKCNLPGHSERSEESGVMGHPRDGRRPWRFRSRATVNRYQVENLPHLSLVRLFLVTAGSLIISSSCFGQNSKPAAWAAEAVFYQIFPERFCNGDPKNDPTRESLEYTDWARGFVEYLVMDRRLVCPRRVGNRDGRRFLQEWRLGPPLWWRSPGRHQ